MIKLGSEMRSDCRNHAPEGERPIAKHWLHVLPVCFQMTPGQQLTFGIGRNDAHRYFQILRFN